MSILRAEISDDFFFSHRPGFWEFCIFVMLNIVYDPLLTRKTPFSTVHSFARIRLLLQILGGGADAWAVPPPQILGDRPPQSPPLLPPQKLTKTIPPKIPN